MKLLLWEDQDDDLDKTLWRSEQIEKEKGIKLQDKRKWKERTENIDLVFRKIKKVGKTDENKQKEK